jgi:hypothetical protein
MSRVTPILNPHRRPAHKSHRSHPTRSSTTSASSISSIPQPTLSTLQDTPAPRPTDLCMHPHSPRSHPMRRENSPHGRSSFVGTVHSHDSFHPSLTVSSRVRLFATQSFSLIISSFFLIFVVIWAFFHRLKKEVPAWIRREQPAVYSWDRPEYRKQERVVNDVGYYAHQVGFDIVDEEVQTADGYLLR